MSKPTTEKNTKKRLKLSNKAMITIWIVISVLFAGFIHWHFSIPAPSEWWKHKWAAGDILTYVSTVALGLLAVWQNQRFKEENDKAQIRMEELAKSANEISIINKIVERESERISRLRDKVQNLVAACNTESANNDLLDITQQPADFRKIFIKIKMDSRENQIRLSSVELLSELSSYTSEEKTKKLIDLVSQYANHSITLVKQMRACGVIDATYSMKTNAENEFIKFSSDYPDG